MRSQATRFVCQQCGEDFPKWSGQCPNCGSWNSLVETEVLDKKATRFAKTSWGASLPISLSSIKKTDYSKRVETGTSELDRVLGGGIVPGMVVLVAGEPGIGKSTLLLQIASNFSGVFYVSGEESTPQLASRAARLGVKTQNIQVLEETDVDEVISQVSQVRPISLIIIDSIQTLTTQDLTGTAGSIGQVKECAARLTIFAKKTSVPLFMSGQVTKEGAIAGPRVLEHMVDTVLWFEGDRRVPLRVIRCIKNRFGSTDEVGVFSMEEKGLVGVDNPSKVFLGESGKVPGSAIAVLLEGTRPILVEIQALVVPTKLAFPRRVASGIDPRRLEIITAVLTRRVGLPLWEYDVFVNAAGGIRITEPASDLALGLSIASAYWDKPVLKKVAAIGEIGLLGEIRETVQEERRLKEAKRLGFTNVVRGRNVKTVGEAIKKYISRKQI